MDAKELITQGNAEALKAALQTGELSAQQATQACLDLVDAAEPDILAWKHLNPDAALAQAAKLDAHFAQFGPSGALHGMPVGIKDVIDTKDMPTGNGTPAHEGRQPDRDATCVANLRKAGAVIIGKTESTELAFMHPSPSRNPHNLGHTPGGSSAGSAAAVGANTLPLALGTQTGGSVVRPASFCGCVGFKPSLGLIPRDGVAMQSHTLDTVGVLTSDLSGARLLTQAAARTPLPQSPIQKPRLMFTEPPGWDEAAPDMQSAISDYAQALGSICTFEPLPAEFAQAPEVRNRINFFEMAHYYAPILATAPDDLSDVIKEAMAVGRSISVAQYRADLRAKDALIQALLPLFERYDAIITPAALGTAPEGFASTGSSIFNGIWTMTGAPSVTLPLLTGENGLPMGVQLSGKPGHDAQLLDVADWIATKFPAV